MSREAMQQALDALTLHGQQYPHMVKGYCLDAIAALKAALAEQPASVAIRWTRDGDKTCGYSNWLGETSFGRILVTWKGWKDYPCASVDEFPGDFSYSGDPDDVKAACEAEFQRRLAAAIPPGHVVVPVEPTPEMKRAATLIAPTWDDNISAAKYRAMIGARPGEKP